MDLDSLLALIRSVLAQPTAPFHEDAVRGEILMQLAQCPHVRVSRDLFGNVIAHYQRGSAAPRYAFAAHMDHPGYVGEEFLGGVPEEYRAKKPPTRDFGAFAMWDLPACEVKDGRIHSRACDDLINCATILALFHELERTQTEASVLGLFSRAEEVGFVGAIHLAKSGESGARHHHRLAGMQLRAQPRRGQDGRGSDHPRRRQNFHFQRCRHPCADHARRGEPDPPPALPHERRHL
ncbi:MAG: M28 family peptidase [Chthoniobacter sp.]